MRRVGQPRGVPGIAAELRSFACPLQHYDGRQLDDSPGLTPLGERLAASAPTSQNSSADGQRAAKAANVSTV